jgi:hypothetical protein
MHALAIRGLSPMIRRPRTPGKAHGLFLFSSRCQGRELPGRASVSWDALLFAGESHDE